MCEHMNFHATVEVNRVQHPEAMSFLADIRIRCADCEHPFAFVGLPCGMNYTEPMVSPDHLELRAPVTPEGVRPPRVELQGFRMNTGRVQ